MNVVARAALLMAIVTALPQTICAQDTAAADRPPNILLIYSDDAGWADFGFMPHAAEDIRSLTPNLDAFASQGMMFTQAYMSGVVCSPSRAGMLTGRYQQRFGHENNIPPGYMRGGMDLEHRTIADHLHTRGYSTGLIGKWHLGYPADYQPNQRGFDEFIGLLQGARGYYPIENVSDHRVIQHNGEPLPEEGYVTDRFGDAACEFIRDHADEAFFLFVSFTAPHGPLQPRKDDEEFLAGLGIERKQRRNFAGLMHAMDQNIGRILETLTDAGLNNHTLVIFTNDNGGQTQVGANNGPLRGRKGTMYEGGSRVPMVMRWPGVIEAGTQSAEPVISLDFLPTFMQLAGESTDDIAHDGVDLTPLIRGEVDSLPPRPLFWRMGGSAGDVAMRDGDWKLVWRRGARANADEGDEPPTPPTPELYNLSNDLGEQTDLAASHPDRVKAMLEHIAAWEAELQKPRWGPGSN